MPTRENESVVLSEATVDNFSTEASYSLRIVVIRTLCIAAVLFVANAGVCHFIYGGPFANVPALLMSFSCWFLVVMAVGDQIVKNWRSGRAAQQLSWNVFLSNIFENVAFVLLSWATGDPVYVMTRVFGLFFDQVVFWQMLASSESAQRYGLPRTLLMYATGPFFLVAFALLGVPLLYETEIRSPLGLWVANASSFLCWAWVAISWCLQIHKNWKVGVLTGRDFSLYIPTLIEIYLCAAIANEFLNGTNRFVPLFSASVGLTINTILMVQSYRYWKAWSHSPQRDGLETPEIAV